MGIKFRNISDRYTWLDQRGRKNYPMLFDQTLQTKNLLGSGENF